MNPYYTKPILTTDNNLNKKRLYKLPKINKCVSYKASEYTEVNYFNMLPAELKAQEEKKR